MEQATKPKRSMLADNRARITMSRDPVKPRVIQYQGKRYGIRMEDSFWSILEDEAKVKGCRLNELVHECYNSKEANGNKTSYLRQHAIEWLASELSQARRRLHLNQSEALNVLRMTRRPALLIDKNLNAAHINKRFENWLLLAVKRIDEQIIGNTRVSFQASQRILNLRLTEGEGMLLAEPAAILLPGLVIPLKLDLTLFSGMDGSNSYLAVFN